MNDVDKTETIYEWRYSLVLKDIRYGYPSDHLVSTAGKWTTHYPQKCTGWNQVEKEFTLKAGRYIFGSGDPEIDAYFDGNMIYGLVKEPSETSLPEIIFIKYIVGEDVIHIVEDQEVIDLLLFNNI